MTLLCAEGCYSFFVPLVDARPLEQGAMGNKGNHHVVVKL